MLCTGVTAKNRVNGHGDTTFCGGKMKPFGIFNLQKMVNLHAAAAICSISPKIEFELQSILFRHALKVPQFRSI